MTALEEERRDLRAQKEELEAQLASCRPSDKTQRRDIRVKIALIDDKILSISDRLRQIRATEQAKKERESKRSARSARQSEIARLRAEQAEYRALLETALSRHDPPADSGVSLRELGKSYRYQADVIRHRIQLVREIRAKTPDAAYQKEERLRILTAMQRDLRTMAVICERYYDRTYYRNDVYKI